MKLLVLSTLLAIFLFLSNAYLTNASCSEHSCVNGKCIIIGFNETCVCFDGYFGRHCLHQNCTSQKYGCGQHGACNSTNGYCVCHQGYKGSNCNRTSNCNNITKCENQGVCQLNKSKYECVCQRGFEGDFCEVACVPCGKNNSFFACPSNQFVCDCKDEQSYLNKSGKNNSVTKHRNAGLKPEAYIVISLAVFLTLVAVATSITKYRSKYNHMEECSIETDLIVISELSENL